MAALATQVDTLINWAKGRDPDGKTADIVELLNQSNEIINHIRWEEANGGLKNRTSVRVSLPQVYTRQIGQAVATSTTRLAQFDDAMAIIEAWNVVDAKLAELEADLGQYRFNNALAYFEAMSQEFAYLYFYGDQTQDPTQFTGMSPRYSTMVAANAASAQNVINGGGTGSANSSMWLLTHSTRSLTGIFPKGSMAGLQHTDVGKVPDIVSAGYPSKTMMTYKDQYTWDAGVSLKDWRWNVRICNIDVNNLVAENNAADLLKLMTKAYYRLPSIAMPASTTGNPKTSLSSGDGMKAWYCNRTIREMLHIQAENKVNAQLTYSDIAGMKTLTYGGVPIYNCDQLLTTEATVV